MYTSCGRDVAALGLGRPRPPTRHHSLLVYLAHDTCSFRIPARVAAATAAARRSTVSRRPRRRRMEGGRRGVRGGTWKGNQFLQGPPAFRSPSRARRRVGPADFITTIYLYIRTYYAPRIIIIHYTVLSYVRPRCCCFCCFVHARARGY